MGQIKYTFEAIANRPKEQLDVLAKTHAIKYDFSDAFGIDTKQKKDPLYQPETILKTDLCIPPRFQTLRRG